MWVSRNGRCDIAGNGKSQHDFDGKGEGNSCAESCPDQKEEKQGSRREVSRDENTTDRPDDEKLQDSVRKVRGQSGTYHIKGGEGGETR